MPWILGKRTRTKQPQTPVGIDWSHPAAKGLGLAVIGGIQVNLADRKPLVRLVGF